MEAQGNQDAENRIGSMPMKRTPLKRKTQMKRTGFQKLSFTEALEKRKWPKNMGETVTKKTKIKNRTPKRAKQERKYSNEAPDFIASHPVCPVTGGRATQLHHSARRTGKWLNLKRYWIAMSAEGHEWVEKNASQAEKIGLIVRIRETYEDHCAKLLADGVDLDEPIYYNQSR